MSFTHVKTPDHAVYKSMHISHLYRYISAYELSEEEWQNLVQMLEAAVKKAKETRETQLVDKSGEFTFHVTPAGYLILMIPWKIFEIVKEPEEA